MTTVNRRPLTCSVADYESLHQDLDRIRSSSKAVTVSAPALRALLVEHALLITLNQGKVIDPSELETEPSAGTRTTRTT